MNAERSQTDWSFVLRWVAITTLTFMIAAAIAHVSSERLGNGLGNTRSFAVVSGAWVGGLLGLGLGIGQAIALRAYGINTTRWILHTVLGGAISFALFSFLTAQMEEQSQTRLALMAGSAVGQGIGATQSFFLKSRFTRAIAWVLITTVTFTVAALIAYNLNGGARDWTGLVAMSLTVASITGFGAARLFVKTRPVPAAL